MITINKSDEKYVIIDGEDIIVAMKKAKINNDPILNKLMNIYNGFDENFEPGKYMIKSDNLIFNYIKNTEGVIYEEDYITLQSLSFALARAIYEYNHDIKKSIIKYFRLLMDARINQEETTIVKNLIADDQKVMYYINKFESFDQYIKHSIKKRLDNKKDKPMVKEIEVIKTQSYVIM